MASDSTLFKAVNNWATSLTNAITDTDTTITLDSVAGLPTTGGVLTFTDTNEIVHYTSISGNNLTVERGYDGTTAASHSAGQKVEMRWIAAHHNVLKDEIIFHEDNSIAYGIADLSTTDTAIEKTNVISYHEDGKDGGGIFHWNSSQVKANHNGGTIIDPTIPFPTDWTDQSQLKSWFLVNWEKGTAYSLNDLRTPTTANGVYYKCTTAGTSGANEPTWNTTDGNTTTDNNSPAWAAATNLDLGTMRIPSTANGYNYEITTAGITGSTEPTFPTNPGDTVTDNVDIPTWAASTAYSLGDIIIPTTANGYTYECTTAGTSDSSEPTWGTTVGGTTADGTAVWTCRAQAVWTCRAQPIWTAVNQTGCWIRQYNVLSVKDFGAKGDGVTDDSAVINNAAAFAKSSHKPLYFPKGDNSYLCNSQLDLREIDVIMDGSVKINFAGIGVLAGTAGTAIMNKNIKLNVYRDYDWTAGNVGILLTNCYSSDINIVRASGFEKGVIFKGNNSGFAYNNITLQYVYDNKYQVILTDDAAGGYCNENLFLGGRLGSLSIHPAVAGIVITSEHSYQQNNNIFIKPSLEIQNSGNTTYGVIFEHAYKNQIIDARTESCDYAVKFEADAQDNLFQVGSGVTTYIDDATYPGNYVFKTIALIYWQSILDKTSLMDAWVDSSGKTHVPGFSIRYYYNSNAHREISSDQIAPATNYLSIGGNTALGIRVDTSIVKKFMILRHCPTGYGGRIFVKCFDAKGNNLGGTEPLYVKGSTTLSYWSGTTTNFGGYYRTGADSTASIELAFHDDVKSAFIGIMPGSNSAEVSNIDILAKCKNIPRTYLDYNEAKEISPYKFATAIPTIGTWKKGEILQNAEPSLNETSGWVCLTSGTMGTLATTTGDTVDGKAILTNLSQIVGLDKGVYLDVAGAYSANYITKTITKIASTTVDASSASGQKVLNVTDTTNFAVGETIIIDRGTNNEVMIIGSIQDGVSLTLTTDLANTYTNETVENCVVMNDNATATVNDAAVTYHNATFQAMPKLGVTQPKTVVTIADGDTTPDVSGGEVFITSANTNATEITDLDNPTTGQIVTLIGGSDTNASTITDGGNFKLNTNMTLGLDDSITLFVKADNNYIELSRSTN